jgi:hypothetical protein
MNGGAVLARDCGLWIELGDGTAEYYTAAQIELARDRHDDAVAVVDHPDPVRCCRSDRRLIGAQS